MTTALGSTGTTASPKLWVRLFANPWIRRFGFAILAVEVFMWSILPCFQNTYEFLKARATADAAPLRYSSEAALAAEKLKTEIETARNAAEKMRGDAATLTSKAGILRQKSVITLETARNSALLQQSTADRLESEVENLRYNLGTVTATYFGNCRARDDIRKIKDAASGKC